MNRLLSRTSFINRIIPRRELYIGTSLCWRGGNDKTQYGKPADSWLGLSNKSGRLTTIIKGSPDPSHFIFEINFGKSRIRHTTLKLNDEFPDQLKIFSR